MPTKKVERDLGRNLYMPIRPHALLLMVISYVCQAEEDLGAGLLKKLLIALACANARIGCELSRLNSGSSEEILVGLQEVLDSEKDNVPGASEIFPSDEVIVHDGVGCSN